MMKKTMTILILLSMGLYSNSDVSISEPYLADGNMEIQNLKIKADKEECFITYFTSDYDILDNDCLKTSNSKGIKIFCTKNKKVCKTENELKKLLKEKNKKLKEDIKFVKASQLLGATFYTYSLNARSEKCELMYKNNEKLTDETCISLKNTKGMKIHCTKNKKMCKTEKELNEFIAQADVEPKETLDEENYKEPLVVEKKLESFGSLIDACEDLDTTYETKQCRKSVKLSKYEFTGKITNVLTENEFTMRVASEHNVDIKGDFNIDAVLKVQKSGETVTVIGILTDLGTGIVFHHKASFVE